MRHARNLWKACSMAGPVCARKSHDKKNLKLVVILIKKTFMNLIAESL